MGGRLARLKQRVFGGKKVAAGIGGRLADLADDLLHLEVNTIIKAGIFARKMPSPPHALLDILGDYTLFLGDVADRAGAGPAADAVRLQLRPLVKGPRTNGRNSFTTVRLVCEALLDLPPAAVEASDATVTERIMRNCSELDAFIGRLLAGDDAATWEELLGRTRPELRADPRADRIELPGGELALLRKIWEVGAEKVALQTVVGLDGDVITCIQRGCETVEYQALRDIHVETTQLSVKYWSTLAELLGNLIRGSGGFAAWFRR